MYIEHAHILLDDDDYKVCTIHFFYCKNQIRLRNFKMPPEKNLMTEKKNEFKKYINFHLTYFWEMKWWCIEFRIFWHFNSSIFMVGRHFCV